MNIEKHANMRCVLLEKKKTRYVCKENINFQKFVTFHLMFLVMQ